MPNKSFDWTPYLDFVASSDIGLRRGNNQDSYGVQLAHDLNDWRERGHLFVVADGMGAHAAGELASKLAVDHVSHLYRKHRELSPPEAVATAINEANDEIYNRGQANLSFHRMGTTCSSLLLLPQGAVLAHIGDSRVYLCRHNQLSQLTFDHSLVWEMREAGVLDEANQNIPKNVITRSLGPEPHINVDLEGPFPVDTGDTFLLCSDGLTGLVMDDELAAALAHLSPQQAAQLLTNLALLRGGHDNITLIIVRVVADQLGARSGGVSPLVFGEDHQPATPVHVGLWIALGLLLLVGGALFAVNRTTYGWIASALSLIPGFAILSKKLGLFREGGVMLSGGRKLGKAPYTQTSTGDEQELAQRMSAFFTQARDTAHAKEWDLDWTALDALVLQMQSALEAGRAAESISHAIAISGMLAETCRQRAKQAAASEL